MTPDDVAQQIEDAVSPVYRERAQLLALLAKAAGRDGAAVTEAPDAPGWWLLGLNVGGKVLTWHLSPRDLDLFDHVPRVGSGDPRVRWDGHSTAEKYRWLHNVAAGPLIWP